ncbi:hypothetical protein C8Q77DRAFT_1022941, partial [Trametes polyzona]
TGAPVTSTTYYYSDGNVVVRVDSTYFRLYRSRLEQYCGYFKELFEAYPPDRPIADQADMTGCPVYATPNELSRKDFETFLSALEVPLTYSSTPGATADDARALIRAAHCLSCDLIFNFAAERLHAFWPSDRPPPAESYSPTLFPPPISAPVPSSSPDPGASESDSRTHDNARYTVSFARTYKLPRLLKRAFYELLASPEFWDALAADRAQVPLTEDDALRLFHARHVLQNLWRKAVIEPPPRRVARDGTVGCSDRQKALKNSENRYNSGGRFFLMLASGLVDPGAEDPLRYNLLGELKDEQRGKWCRSCLREWEFVMAKKREEWWVMLDDLLHI